MGFYFYFLGAFCRSFWKTKYPLLVHILENETTTPPRALKHLLLFHFSFLMILGGYPSGIKGGKKTNENYAQAFMLSKALGKALNHMLYHNWAYAQLHLTRALIPVRPEVSCFTCIYLPG
jgi:hypothetical protein